MFQGRANLEHAAVAPHFGDKSSSGTKRAFDAVEHGVRIFHPVQRSVAENGVEFAVEIKRLAILHTGIEAALLGRRNLIGARINADDLAAEVD